MLNPAERCDDFTTCLLAATADCYSMLDLGCGFGDKIACTRASIRVGVDVHPPYIEIAKRKWSDYGITFYAQNVVDYVKIAVTQDVHYDGIIMIDFIEHLEKDIAVRLLEDCWKIANTRVIVFTPNGIHTQNKDPYELGGDHWQTHRSTWTCKDLIKLNYSAFVMSRYNAIFATREKSLF